MKTKKAEVVSALEEAEGAALKARNEKLTASLTSRSEIKRTILNRMKGIDTDNDSAVKRILGLPAAKSELSSMLDQVFGRTMAKALPEVKK